MEIEVEMGLAGVTVVRLRGRLDMVTAPAAKERLAHLAEQGQARLVVDLRGVEHLDSSGLGALISGLKSARQAGGDLRIARIGDQPRLLLRLTTLERVLRPYATVEEAVAAFG